MWNWIRQLDRLLRGETTSIPVLRAAGLDVPIVGLAIVIDLLGVVYGACMGLFSILGSGSGEWKQIPASMVKVPALYLLTLLVTLPSLYVFNGLVGSRLRFLATVRLMISSLAIMLAVLASAGPIVAFFSLCTTSHPFMVLLNVFVFAVSGFLGLGFLLQTLNRMTVLHAAAELDAVLPTAESDATSEPISSPLGLPAGHAFGRDVKAVFRIWLVVFAIVGAQMGWVLRPFIGSPDSKFVFFSPRQSNFFEAVVENVNRLMDSHDRKDR